MLCRSGNLVTIGRGEYLQKYMREAIKEAMKARRKGEVPVGAVIVKDGEIVARGHNQIIKRKNATFHAEIVAIRKATKKLRTSRLTGATMYVTLEPCSMCAGALVLSKIDKIVIGTSDPKTGACGSVLQIVDNENLNHRVTVITGVLEEECSSILKEFFRIIRKEKRGKKL